MQQHNSLNNFMQLENSFSVRFDGFPRLHNAFGEYSLGFMFAERTIVSKMTGSI